MANDIAPNTLVKILRAEGLNVKLYSGWSSRCRCHNGPHYKGGAHVRSWEPINGTMVHITAGGLGSRSVNRYIADIINGDRQVPTKAQFVTAPNGDVYINSCGRANHAGRISTKSLAKAVAGSFSLSGYSDQRGGAQTDGNSRFYGIENIAATSMTAAQRESSVRICAAIARHYGWDGRESVGHGECSSQRSYSDPNLNMGTFRKDVMNRVKGPASAGKHAAKPTEDDEVSAKDVWGWDGIPVDKTISGNYKKNPYWTPSSFLVTTLREAKAANRNAAATLGLVKKMAEKGSGLTAAEVTAAVEDGLKSYIDNAEVTLNATVGDES